MSQLSFVSNLGLLFYYWLQSMVLIFLPSGWRYKSVEDEIVLITGGGQGLGRLLGLKFAELGARVILWDINEQGLKESRSAIEKLGAKCWTYTCDVSDRSMVYSTAKRVERDVGPVGILINNAGIVSGKSFLQIPDEKIVKTIEVNTLAHFWTCKAFLPKMMQNNKGHVVTISSLAGYNGAAFLTDYCSSKFGAVGFHESLWYETRTKGYDGIQFTLVAPYHMDTGMFAGARSALMSTIVPEDAAENITDAVLTNMDFVAVPRMFRYLGIIKFMIPYKSLAYMNDILGGDEFMKDFTGRGIGFVSNDNALNEGS